MNISNKEQLKHFQQQNEILNHMKNLDLLQSNTIYIEYGAGKAKLAYQMSECEYLKQLNSIQFLLIEKSGSRYKAENKAKHLTMSNLDRFLRIRCGIEHVSLADLPIFKNSDQRKFVAVCKHLCGNGFDFALNSIQNSSTSVNFGGAFLIPCCHHRNEWKYFTGKEIFLQFGIPRNFFEPMCQMSSWATCGFSNSDNNSITIGSIIYRKEDMGRKCKYILDFCRGEEFKLSMKRNGKRCVVENKYFIDRVVTPENLALIVKIDSY